MSALLPPNATTEEMALVDAICRAELDTLVAAPRALKSNVAEPIQPWLAAEWGLADLAGFFDDTQALLEAGWPWLQVRGTAASVQLALSWIAMPVTLEEDGARLQIDTGTPEAPAQLDAIKHLVNASIPAHVQLYRLYHGYDRRVLHSSTGDRWDDAFLSDDSGVWIDGIKLSFGRTWLINAVRPATLSGVQFYRLHSALIRYPDVLRWGVMRFGDAFVRNNPVMRGHLMGIINAVGLPDPLLMTGNRRMARAAFLLSEDARLGEPNTRFGGYSETALNRFYWSEPESMLSDFDYGRHKSPIEEVWIMTTGIGNMVPDFTQIIAAVTPSRRHSLTADWRGQLLMDGSLRWSDAKLTESTGLLFIDRRHVSDYTGIGPRGSNYGWTGGWDDRRWGGDNSITHQTLTA